MTTTKLLLAAGCALSITAARAQNGSTDPVLMTVDGQPVTRTEFEAIYKKNNKEASVTKEALDEYLELFINYKLKVREAETLGMDTITKFRNELDGYRKQLARPYLIDRELNDALMREAYDRSTQEVRASHILIQAAPDASPEDSLAAWKRITALRERIIGGEDFAAVAKGLGGSEDPSAQKNGGDLGWFSALQMVYPFENAAFNTPEGTVSQPVRTRFGYHIVKVTGRRPARGQMKVAHIMLRSTDQDSPEKQANAEQRIREIHRQLGSNAINFNEAALKYSEDESSSTKGGELAQFGTGKMIEEFEDAAFALRTPGELSNPVKTRFGWHIIRCIEAIPPPSFDQAKAELKTKIARDSRAEITRKAFMERLRKEYGFATYQKNIDKAIALVDSNVFKKGTATTDTILRKQFVEGPFVKGKGKLAVRYRRELAGAISGGRMLAAKSRPYEEMTQTMDDTVVVREVMEGWAYDRKKAAKLSKPVFSFAGGSMTQRELLDQIESRQRRERVQPIAPYMNARVSEIADERILAYEDSKLEEKYPEFRMLMKEYRDGILLFELTDQKVWGKAVKDSTGLEAFHKANADRFMWPTRFECDLYACADASVSKQMRAQLKRGKRGKDLMDIVNKSNPLALSIDGGTFTVEEKPYLAGLSTIGLSKDIAFEGKMMVVDVKRILQPTPKAIDEARGVITAAYQDNLEKEWIAELRAKYPVTVDKAVLYSIK
ncbi:MAG: peptidylprolyl isomerase [Flavobacteriales bacterium]|nr:peptidylprolyl isomerase [Flavobacteriales bacterium]